jgi:hypothetical protein
MSAAKKSRQPTTVGAAMPSSYPDVERLVADGDLVKIGPGYSVQTETGFEAISPYIVGLSIGRNGKPTVYRLARRTI